MNSISNFFKKKFNTYYGFEKGIDISCDEEVLFRKNVVIKNIIFLSNILYMIIMFIANFGVGSNLIIVIILFPFTFSLNLFLKNLIYSNKQDLIKQQIAMYFSCFYMFLSALIVYLKLKIGANSSVYGELGYILLYYSLVVCSFYQAKSLLKNVYFWCFILFTVIHFTITYNIVFSKDANDGYFYVLSFIKSCEFKDIILRSIILLIFMTMLYINVVFSEYLQTERKNELIKRKSIENQFLEVVNDIFSYNILLNIKTEEEKKELCLISDMSYKLASLLGKDSFFLNELKKFSLIHINDSFSFDVMNIKDDNKRFNAIKEESLIGKEVIKRIELDRKIEDIIRRHLEGFFSDSFVFNIKKNLSDDISQIIMICSMYVILRSIKSYKRALNHQITIENLEKTYRIYYDSLIFERFIKFSSDFEIMYDSYIL